MGFDSPRKKCRHHHKYSLPTLARVVSNHDKNVLVIHRWTEGAYSRRRRLDCRDVGDTLGAFVGALLGDPVVGATVGSDVTGQSLGQSLGPGLGQSLGQSLEG
jgi:hypothetical protein